MEEPGTFDPPRTVYAVAIEGGHLNTLDEGQDIYPYFLPGEVNPNDADDGRMMMLFFDEERADRVTKWLNAKKLTDPYFNVPLVLKTAEIGHSLQLRRIVREFHRQGQRRLIVDPNIENEKLVAGKRHALTSVITVCDFRCAAFSEGLGDR